MANPVMSKKRAAKVCGALFFLFLIVTAITQNWWPGIMLTVGLPLALRQYLLGRKYDMAITLLVFVGTYITVDYDIAWAVFLPILFSIGAFYVLIRELIEEDLSSEQNQKDDFEEKP